MFLIVSKRICFPLRRFSRGRAKRIQEKISELAIGISAYCVAVRAFLVFGGSYSGG
jgi:hypothetical protein